jgi:hypothetical protein
MEREMKIVKLDTRCAESDDRARLINNNTRER